MISFINIASHLPVCRACGVRIAVPGVVVPLPSRSAAAGTGSVSQVWENYSSQDLGAGTGSGQKFSGEKQSLGSATPLGGDDARAAGDKHGGDEDMFEEPRENQGRESRYLYPSDIIAIRKCIESVAVCLGCGPELWSFVEAKLPVHQESVGHAQDTEKTRFARLALARDIEGRAKAKMQKAQQSCDNVRWQMEQSEDRLEERKKELAAAAAELDVAFGDCECHHGTNQMAGLFGRPPSDRGASVPAPARENIGFDKMSKPDLDKVIAEVRCQLARAEQAARQMASAHEAGLAGTMDGREVAVFDKEHEDDGDSPVEPRRNKQLGIDAAAIIAMSGLQVTPALAAAAVAAAAPSGQNGSN